VKNIFIILLFPLITFGQNEIFFSEYGEGNSFNKWVEIYNPTSQSIFLDNYRYNFCWNGCDSLLWEFSIPFDSGYVLMPGNTYLLVHYAADSALLNLANQTTNLMSNGNDVIGLLDYSQNIIIDIIGVFDSTTISNGWDIDGVISATKDHTIFRKDDICKGNYGNWSLSDGSFSPSEWTISTEDDFSNLSDHSSNCLTSSVKNNTLSSTKKLLKVTNILGKQVINTVNNYQIKLYIYDNGYVEKKILFK